MNTALSKVEHIETHRWDSDSFLPRIDYRQGGNHPPIAYIYAPDGAENDPARLAQLNALLISKGWLTTPDSQNGKSVLRVSGFSGQDDLASVLNAGGYLQGTPDVSRSSLSPYLHKGRSPIESLKANMLRDSGIFYFLGGVVFAVGGIRRGAFRGGKEGEEGMSQLLMASAFMVGDAALAAFCGNDDSTQVRSLMDGLKKHLASEGIAIPTGADTVPEAMGRKDGFLEKSYDYLHDHINTFKTLAEIVGGAYYFNTGRTTKIPGTVIARPNQRKMAAGLIIVAGWMASLLIKEKKPEELSAGTAASVPDPQHADDKDKKDHPDNPIERTWHYIEERPSCLAGASGLIHNGLTVWGALKERKDNIADAKQAAEINHNYAYDLAAVSMMMIANTAYAVSHRSTNPGIKSRVALDDVYTAAAQTLLALPTADREAAEKDIATYFAKRPEVRDTPEQIAHTLDDKIGLLSHNPWMKRVGAQPDASLTR